MKASTTRRSLAEQPSRNELSTNPWKPDLVGGSPDAFAVSRRAGARAAWMSRAAKRASLLQATRPPRLAVNFFRKASEFGKNGVAFFQFRKVSYFFLKNDKKIDCHPFSLLTSTNMKKITANLGPFLFSLRKMRLIKKINCHRFLRFRHPDFSFYQSQIGS